MFDPLLLVRSSIRALKPYSSARDEFKGEASVWLDANENPVDNGLNRYPDPLQRGLKARISELKGMAVDNMFLGNGSDEAIDLLFRAFCRPGVDKVLMFPPTYGMYQVSAGINDVEMIQVPLNADFQLDMPKVLPRLPDPHLKIIFICSPNNPTGNIIRPEDVIELLEAFNGLVVVDEAYIDFAETDGMTALLRDHPNLVVLQTLSKAWGMAGIRLGMAFADARVIGVMNSIKPPYNVNVLTQRKALEQLQDTVKFKKQVEMVRQQRTWLQAQLALVPSVIRIYPSDANFLLVQFKDSKQVYDILASKGIVVRDRSAVVSGCLRITVGTPSENEQLIWELKGITQ